MTPLRPRSLKTRSILIVLTIYLAAGALTLGAFVMTARGIVEGFGRRFAAKHVDLDRNRILAPIRREVALARKLADSAVLKQWCRHETDPAARGLALDELESYRRLFADHSYFFVPDASRHYYFNNARDEFRGRELRYTLHRSDPTMAWYFATLDAVDDYALNVDSSEQLGVVKVWINAIVKDRDRKVGMGGTGLELSSFVREVVESGERGVSTVLIDRRGALQAHPNPRYMEFNARTKDESRRMTLFQLLGSDDDRAVLSACLDRFGRGESALETFYLTVEGRRWLAAAAPLPEIGWIAVALVDPSQVMGLRAFSPILIVLGVSLLATVALVSGLLHRVVLTPLERLTASARELAAGRYGVELPSSRTDEIGSLTDAFNRMSATIRDHTVTLETKVAERTDALSEANRNLTASNEKILDSLRYGRLIQSSLLPSAESVARHLPDHFLLYRPRDLVGGDFYVLVPDEGGLLLGVADCTGHGAPGAFMTMCARAVLGQLLDRVGPDDPALLLGEMNRAMKAVLEQEGPRDGPTELDNGLELALLRVAPSEGRLRFAGGRLPLLLAGPGAPLQQIPGDRHSLGYRRSDPRYRFTNRELPLTAGTRCYLFTDGVLDQAGGGRGFGFGYRRLRDAIERAGQLPMAEQGAALEQSLATYQAERAQTDDVTVLGFRWNPELSQECCQ
ncbi:MAG: SpoIIE family protein phosphatase [Deltaproteobacteria bacterium]|nr:SpoIIE family protein phosphatase [Deltaproteobacteria bacterium]